MNIAPCTMCARNNLPVHQVKDGGVTGFVLLHSKPICAVCARDVTAIFAKWRRRMNGPRETPNGPRTG